MLEPIMHILSSKRIVLASGSPRRKQILSNIGLNFEVIPSTFEETLDKSSFQFPYEYVKETARHKLLDVASKLQNEEVQPDLIIGADTVVTMNNKIYEKPNSKEEAFDMLSSFNNRHHTVYTGVVLAKLKPDSTTLQKVENRYDICTFHEGTEVLFGQVDSEIIQAYIETNEPMDKAGGYGIQARGATLIQSIKGDYFNVMGFPLYHFAKTLLNIYRNP